VVDLLERWDEVEDQRNSILANGRQSYQEHVRKLQLEEEGRKAQFVRESTAMFEDAMTTLAPKIDPYQPIEGNQQWNESIPHLKQAARKIFNGEVDKKTLAEVAILAPAAVVYHRVIVPAAMKRIQELTAQIERMRGLSPTVSDRGGDTAQLPPKSATGDFVKELVDRFRKESGA
jgi:2-succinyl-5-enolpyruvyl-6-hydroxy-3-cyclohexene-1-carboxylate synthase